MYQLNQRVCKLGRVFRTKGTTPLLKMRVKRPLEVFYGQLIYDSIVEVTPHERYGTSYNSQVGALFNSLVSLPTRKTSKFYITGPLWVTDVFHSQRTSNAECVFCHGVIMIMWVTNVCCPPILPDPAQRYVLWTLSYSSMSRHTPCIVIVLF